MYHVTQKKNPTSTVNPSTASGTTSPYHLKKGTSSATHYEKTRLCSPVPFHGTNRNNRNVTANPGKAAIKAT